MANTDGLDQKNKDVPWYDKEIENLAEPARELLEKYSGIPPERVDAHLKEVRDKAWDIFPYPCIGKFHFLDLSMSKTAAYPEILERLKSGQKLLDLGCCFGQELRKLASDGAPPENLYGSDLRLDFMELGYDLFLDKGKLKSHFIVADVFDENSDLKQLDGQIDIIHTGSFFHLFNWDEQFAVAKRVVKLLRPQSSSLIIGRQVGHWEPGEFPKRSGKGTRYRHDEKSWERLWKEVGEATDSKWKVDVKLTGIETSGDPRFSWNDNAGRVALHFIVRRE